MKGRRLTFSSHLGCTAISHFVHFKPLPQTLLAQTAQVCGVTKLEPLNSCGRRSVEAFSAQISSLVERVERAA